MGAILVQDSQSAVILAVISTKEDLYGKKGMVPENTLLLDWTDHVPGYDLRPKVAQGPTTDPMSALVDVVEQGTTPP